MIFVYALTFFLSITLASPNQTKVAASSAACASYLDGAGSAETSQYVSLLRAGVEAGAIRSQDLEALLTQDAAVIPGTAAEPAQALAFNRAFNRIIASKNVEWDVVKRHAKELLSLKAESARSRNTAEQATAPIFGAVNRSHIALEPTWINRQRASIIRHRSRGRDDYGGFSATNTDSANYSLNLRTGKLVESGAEAPERFFTLSDGSVWSAFLENGRLKIRNADTAESKTLVDPATLPELQKWFTDLSRTTKTRIRLDLTYYAIQTPRDTFEVVAVSGPRFQPVRIDPLTQTVTRLELPLDDDVRTVYFETGSKVIAALVKNDEEARRVMFIDTGEGTGKTLYSAMLRPTPQGVLGETRAEVFTAQNSRTFSAIEDRGNYYLCDITNQRLEFIGRTDEANNLHYFQGFVPVESKAGPEAIIGVRWEGHEPNEKVFLIIASLENFRTRELELNGSVFTSKWTTTPLLRARAVGAPNQSKTFLVIPFNESTQPSTELIDLQTGETLHPILPPDAPKFYGSYTDDSGWAVGVFGPKEATGTKLVPVQFYGPVPKRSTP